MFDQAPPAPSPYVIEANDHSFTLEVVERSVSTPVLVDCWAEWCEPCRSLGPTLERLADDYAGRFILAKVNIDEAQQVAMALRIQSVPFMVLFVEGRPVDALVGNQSESALRAFLDQHLPPDVADPYVEGELALEAGELDLAKRAFERALQSEARRGDALLALAKLSLKEGEVEAAMLSLKEIPADHPQRETAERILKLSSFADDVRDEAELRASLEPSSAEPPPLEQRVEAWYQLGATLALSGRFEEACEALLKVVSLDRSYRDDGGRAALLLIFDALGAEGPIVNSYRRKLASLLF